MRRTIGSNIGNEPRLGALVEANELESYSFPQGVLSQLMREIAAGPARARHAGRPRARTSTRARPAASRTPATTEDLVEVVTLRGREWLLFHAFPIDVAVIRGTTADEDGNLTMEGEAVQGEMLAMAMAARNSGGIVIAQVRQLATRGSLRMRDVQGARRARRPRLRRPRPVADVHHPRLAVLRRARCAGRSGRSRRCRSTCARSSPAARCSSSRAAPSATSASGSASSSAGWPGRRASPTSWC